MNHRVGFVSLGCPKALVDSERIITQLRAQGYELVETFQDAGIVIINTCGFIESAIEESLNTIQEAMAENGRVIVTGCLGAKAEIIKKVCPDVLHISGPHAYETVMRAVHKHLPPPKNPFTELVPPQGIKLTPRHYAYLKISEGCNHKCTFCIIPSMRGKLQSYPMTSLLRDAKQLKAAGVRELLVIAQDTSAYGLDTGALQFYELCEALSELGIWVRLHYVYPYPHVDKIIPLMQKGKLLPYLDVPLQHASPRLLKAMRRPANAENTLARIEKWRSICPEIVIRSTFIVGFPGETDEEFEALLSFLETAKLDRVGCFQYSPIEGAHANTLAEQVPDTVKAERFDAFMQLQAKISEEKLRQKINTTQQVLIDRIEGEHVIARSMADAPEIDGLVYVKPHSQLKVGEFANVSIYASDAYDLYGELVR